MEKKTKCFALASWDIPHDLGIFPWWKRAKKINTLKIIISDSQSTSLFPSCLTQSKKSWHYQAEEKREEEKKQRTNQITFFQSSCSTHQNQTGGRNEHVNVPPLWTDFWGKAYALYFSPPPGGDQSVVGFTFSSISVLKHSVRHPKPKQKRRQPIPLRLQILHISVVTAWNILKWTYNTLNINETMWFTIERTVWEGRIPEGNSKNILIQCIVV